MNVKKIAKRSLKIGAWIFGILIALLASLLCAIVWILTPDRLTPLAQDIANESLNAEVSIGRMELTAWSTFPILTLDVDDLRIVSASLRDLPAEMRATLPANADSLIEAKHLHVGVNVLRMLYGTFSLSDIHADNLRVNIVDVDPANANYLISKPSEEPESEEPLSLPTILCDKMRLTGDTRIAYFNAADTLDAKIRLEKVELNNTEGTDYHLAMQGTADCSMGGFEYAGNLPVSLDGGLTWSSDHFADVELNGMSVKVLDIPALIDLSLVSENAFMLDKLAMRLGPVKFDSLKGILPEAYSNLFAGIKSNISATITTTLTEPYDLMGTDLPSIDATLSVPASYIAAANGKARLERVAMDAAMSLNGKTPDKSTINLQRMILEGRAVNIELKGTVDNFLADAHVKGNVKGNADIERVVKAFNLPMSFTVRGDLDADASVDAHLSDLTGNNFQRMRINGSMNLSNLFYDSPADTLSFYARNASINFGSNDKLQIRDNTVDNLLRLTTDIDTLSASMAGLRLTASNGRIGMGCVADNAFKLDTTTIIPLGMRLRSGRLSVEQADGSRIRIRDLDCGGSISRYADSVRVPKIRLALSAKRMFYKDNAARVMLSDSRMNITANMRRRNSRNALRIKRRIDSIRAIHPEWPSDSVLMLASRRKRIPAKADDNVMDLSVDNGLKQLIMRWQLQGSIKSEKGRMFTPYFPLRNSLRNINVQFSMDSVIFKRMTYHVGQSQFDISGGIRNMRTTMLGRNRQPLDLSFFVKADTINVNELIKAATDGMAYANNAVGLNSLDDSDDIDAVSTQVAETTSADSALAAIVVPSNIDANIRLRASNILYSDLFMSKFNGNLLVHDGAINLNELKAKTDMGSARFNALYAAPDRNDIKFGFDLSLSDIQVGKFLKMIPGLDTIMPLLESVDGVIDADLAATTNVDSAMNIVMPSLKAVMKLHGKDLVFMDAATFKKIAKMLLFKNKERNVIDEMTVEMLVENSQMELFPFMFDVDRYRLGVLGHNDLDLNFRYHISVLKSPIPFKFGINIYGNPDDMHFRFGGAKYKDNMAREKIQIVDTTRINLREQINSAFRRGAKAALKSELDIRKRPGVGSDLSIDTTSFSHEDSVMMQQGGFFETPPAPAPANPQPATDGKSGKKSGKKSTKSSATRKEN